MDESQLIQDGVKIDEVTVSVQYTKADLKSLGQEIGGADFALTRDAWLAAQARDWKNIFQIPAILIAVCFVVFLVLGRNPDAKENKGQDAPKE